jgi:hypothetical protein
MLKTNHKYLTILFSIFAIVFAKDIVVEKESDGVYTVAYEKEFQVENQLDVIIRDYSGDIIINGRRDNSLIIEETCSFESYSEKDAQLKYYKSKAGFILNENILEISENKRNEKLNNII